MTTYKAYAPGESASKFKPGDFILTHSKAIPGKVIRAGEFIRYHGDMRDFSHWNHAALIISEDGKLIEAVGRGVSYGHISEYQDVEYYLINTNLNKQSQDQTVNAAISFLDDKYGWVTIASLTIELLTGIKIQFSSSNSIICSALVAIALWAGGYVFDRNPLQMMPADLAAAFNVRVI
jgi:uncharacterized protein YycO